MAKVMNQGMEKTGSRVAIRAAKQSTGILSGDIAAASCRNDRDQTG
jgi:hypothetical protein